MHLDKPVHDCWLSVHITNSAMVRPRRPLAKDPSLDYEEESDWEEEPEGENLSVRLPGNECLLLFDGDWSNCTLQSSFNNLLKERHLNT